MNTESSSNPPLIKGSCPLLQSEDSVRFRLGVARLDEIPADDSEMHADTERDREQVEDEESDAQYSELGGCDDTDRGRSDDDSVIIIQGDWNSSTSEDERDVPEKG